MSKEGEKMGENADPLKQKEKDCVRDFIEKLVSTILGGSVDDASISRMYTDKHCKWKTLLRFLFCRKELVMKLTHKDQNR
jgi:hypothetical protein